MRHGDWKDSVGDAIQTRDYDKAGMPPVMLQTLKRGNVAKAVSAHNGSVVETKVTKDLKLPHAVALYCDFATTVEKTESGVHVKVEGPSDAPTGAHLQKPYAVMPWASGYFVAVHHVHHQASAMSD